MRPLARFENGLRLPVSDSSVTPRSIAKALFSAILRLGDREAGRSVGGEGRVQLPGGLDAPLIGPARASVP